MMDLKRLLANYILSCRRTGYLQRTLCRLLILPYFAASDVLLELAPASWSFLTYSNKLLASVDSASLLIHPQLVLKVKQNRCAYLVAPFNVSQV